MKVGRRLYTFLDFGFRFLFLAAFILQSVLVSIHYFEFRCVSTMEFVVPGKESLKSVNLCFRNGEVLDYEEYLRIATEIKEFDKISYNDHKIRNNILEANFTIRNRFNVSIGSPYDHQHPNNQIRYILGSLICYHITKISEERSFERNPEVGVENPDIVSSEIFSTALKTVFLNNVRHLYIAMTPYNELATVEFLGPGKIPFNSSDPLQVHVSSFFYRFTKLKPPYIDNCANYKSYGHRNRLDAINDCYNSLRIQNINRTSRTKIFDEESAPSFPIEESANGLDLIYCQRIYQKVDCYSEETFSGVKTFRSQSSVTTILNIPSSYVSYVNYNTPKIAFIEFVTYIFGAAVTWLGFRFVSLNPVNFIEKPSATEVADKGDIDLSARRGSSDNAGEIDAE